MDVLLTTFFGVAMAVELARQLRNGPRAALVPAALGALALTVLLTFVRGGFGREKILGRLLMPVGLFWLGLFALAVFELRCGRRGRAALFGALFLGFGTLGSMPLGTELVRSLESRLPQPDPAARYEAVLVLGGGTRLDPWRRPELGPAGDRLRKGAALWHEGRVETLVASGFSPPPFGLGKLSAHTVELWRQMGVPPGATRQLDFPKNTREEIAAFRALAEAEGWQRMGVVSSAWHLPRALALAERAGLEVTPLPADHWAGPLASADPLWFVPQRYGFALLDIWAWETLGRWLGR